MRTRRSPNQEAARISSRSGTRHRRCRCCLPALTGFTTGRRGEADASHHKKARGHSGTIGPWPDFPRGSRPQIWRGSPAIADPPPLRGGDPTMPRDTVYNNSSELNEATVAARPDPGGHSRGSLHGRPRGTRESLLVAKPVSWASRLRPATHYGQPDCFRSRSSSLGTCAAAAVTS